MSALVAQPDAPLGRSDPTRRWGLRCADGTVAFPGVTPVEADRFGAVVGDLPATERAAVLVPVTLPVVVSDGAGPYLLADDGTLMLVLAPHPGIEGVAIAMGAPRPGVRRVAGVRESGSDGLRSAVARADVPERDAVGALDALAAAEDGAAMSAWTTRWSEGMRQPGREPVS